MPARRSHVRAFESARVNHAANHQRDNQRQTGNQEERDRDTNNGIPIGARLNLFTFQKQQQQN